MITVLPVRDREEIKQEFLKRNIDFSDTSMCVKARDKEELLGLCLFDMQKDKVTLKYVEPLGDIMLADGIIRSALHVAAENFIFVADYDNDELTCALGTLGFIKDADKKTVDMDKLFGGCHCKK